MPPVVMSSGVGGGAATGALWASLEPRPPPPLPEELSALRLLQQGNLFGGSGYGEVPLLVPLTNGGVTNLNFDESYGEPQEALIERYLSLMSVAPREAPPSQLAQGGDPAGVHRAAQAAATTASVDTTAPSNQEQQTQQQAQQQAQQHQPATPAALVALGLDRGTLARRALPEALITALYRGLAANAAAFFRSCLAERRRLAALTYGSGPAVPLADRLLAFITGTEGQLAAGSALPDMAELRTAKDTQTALDAACPPREPPPAPFHHELMHMRQQPPPAAPEQPAEEEPDLEALMDLDNITALATAGNVPGLRALMRSLVDAMDYTRTALKQRLVAEGERAQREWGRATEARQAAERLREQLAARNNALAERGAELEAACRRASSAEEALVTERAIVGGLRGQLRQLTADYEEQHRGLRSNLEAQVNAPVTAATAQSPGQSSQPSDNDDPHGVYKLGAQVATLRAELALAELTCQQERAAARQLRVMLESARGTVDMHANRAASAMAEVERLSRLVAASQDLASATSGGIAMLEQQLAGEKAAHRRTTERLQAVGWKFEQARTTVVDIRARAAHNLRKLQTALGDMNVRAVTAERQMADATVELRQLKAALENTTNSWQALRERSERVEVEMESMRRETVVARMDVKEVTDKLRETQVELKTAEARVVQMQQKVMDDADIVLAGKAASQRLETLEKDHEDLDGAHTSLRESHQVLSEAHQELTEEMGAARVRLVDLEARAVQLAELTVQHAELVDVRARLEQQHAGLVKVNSALSSELAAMKRHAEVLAEQVQESRRVAEGAEVALEVEKELHRHTKEELSITSLRRDELAVRAAELSATLDGLDARMKASDDAVERARRTAELAGHQRAEAFAMRDAMMRVRIMLTCDVKEYLSTIDGQVQLMNETLEELRGSLTAVQSRLLDMTPEILQGTMAQLPTVSYDDSQKMCDAVFRMVSHGSQLLETQSEVRKTLVERMELLEDGIKERLATATDYWRQVLVLARGSPRSLVQMVERMTGQACRELQLDPANPLARMVPVGVLEEAGVQLNAQYERVGVLRNHADVTKAQGDAAAKLLEYERQVSAARASEFQALVDALSREVTRLKQRVGSLEANNLMQQRATADMQRMLSDAEWKVAKAHEREALAGIKFMVPHGRETKAVQTVFSDLYMNTGSAGPQQQQQYPHPHPHPRSPLLHARSGIAEAAAESGLDLGCGFGDESNDGAWAASASASAAGLEPPASPASLPPLSALNSPAAPGSHLWGGPPRTSASPYGTVLRPGSSAATVGPSRPQSNLSRGSSSMYPAAGIGTTPGPGRCSSPDTAAAPVDGASTSGSPGDGPGGCFPLSSAPPLDGTTLSRSLSGTTGRMQSAGGAAQQQRRRHPDEVPRRSGGSILSPVPSLNSMHSVCSVASEAAAAGAAGGGGGGGGGGTATGDYVSDGNAVGSDAYNSDEELSSSPSPSLSPPRLLRTPSISVTAAAAAAYAANAGAAAVAAQVKSSPAAIAASLLGPGSLPIRPATAGSASYPSPTGHTHPTRLSGSFLHSSRPASPTLGAPPTPSGIPHGWQHSPWDWLPEAAPMTRGVQPYSRQALLEVIADIHYTKGLHDQVAAAAAFPATSMQQYIGAYFEARHGPRGSSPPAVEVALAQLLVSLEAHSALYEVMLFARVAGLQQAWSSKTTHRNSGSASPRPGTATTSHHPMSGRPRTSRTPMHALSPYASSSGGGLLSPSRPGTAAAAAAARNSRTMSARSNAGINGGPLMLGLVPSGRTGSAADGTDGGSPPTAGETILRLRTGHSPAISSSAAGAHHQQHYQQHPHQHQRHEGGHQGTRMTRRSGSAGARASPRPQPPPPPKPQLRIRPEVVVSEQLSQLLARLGEVSGMEAVSQFISTGRLLGRLRPADLGQTLPEEQHPELHYTVQRVCGALGLQEAPELIVRESLPYGADIMLLQLPNLATTALGLLANTDVDRQPVATPAAAHSAAAGGWRRRAVLLMTPTLVQEAVAATLGDGAAAIDSDELQAMLGAALAPIAMPGGSGWRFDVQSGLGLSSSTMSGVGGAGSAGGAPSAAAVASGTAPTLLSAAEVITAVNVAALNPRAMLSALPTQLQFKWERLLAHLRSVAAAATVSADRGALLATQAVAPGVRAVFRAAAGLSLQEHGGSAEGLLGPSEELLLQAQAMPVSDEEMSGMATMPLHDAAASGAETRRAYALARVALLARWAEAPEYRQTLRSAVM